MSHSVEVISPVSRKVTITVPVQDVNKAINAAARQTASSLTLPGFRKGKVPTSVVLKRFHEDVFSRAAENLRNNFAETVLKEENLSPVSRINSDQETFDADKEYTFTLSFEVMPEIELPEDLSELKIEVSSSAATETEIAAFSLSLLKQAATYEKITEDRIAAEGDVVTFDVDADIDGKPVPSMKAENYTVHLSAPKEGAELSELDKIIRTLHAGEEGNGTMVCPEDHPDEAVRGKTCNIHVKLKEISREVLPELNDDLAKKFGFSNIEELQKVFAAEANRRKAADVRNKAQQKLLEDALLGLEFTVPEVFLNSEKVHAESNLRSFMLQQGMTEEAVESSIKNMTSEVAEEAQVKAREQVFLTALARREHIEVTPKERDAQLHQLAQYYKMDYQKFCNTVYENGAIYDILSRILTAKTLAYMYDKAQKIEIEPKAE